ncbi:KilA-N domain-containing protein [Elizabethkingia meningoseptica]|uniref:KilA-N domain-containing protein n=1 Tax=Elizabethkingia meningoseptica TaxID=238 RepID=UPI00294FFDFF|nr:KilA-N domain-containing protein [Elizabethkingia meningoseptica]MDX8576819.1 KilA-N domain-containing protein [Elizabethkingia sp. HX WYD]
MRVFRVYKKEENDNVFVNATEMAKNFNKLPGDFLRLNQTEEFINTISSRYGISHNAILQVVKGGNQNQGTWMHEDVAIEFARWLNPAFAIWCNSQINQSSIKAGIPVTLYFK